MRGDAGVFTDSFLMSKTDGWQTAPKEACWEHSTQVEMREHGCPNGYENTKPRRKDKNQVRKQVKRQSPERMYLQRIGRARK